MPCFVPMPCVFSHDTSRWLNDSMMQLVHVREPVEVHDFFFQREPVDDAALLSK